MLFTVPLRLLLMISLIGCASRGSAWKCPEFNDAEVSCSCDFPQTLRCSANLTLMETIAGKLRRLPPEETVSLLDCTLQNVTALSEPFLRGVSLHGLVLTSGELRNISAGAFTESLNDLQALGLPNNKFEKVPTQALRVFKHLERLDMSRNKLSSLNTKSFKDLNSLRYLDLNNNQIANVTPDAFLNLKNLTVLNLRENRLRVATVSALTKLDRVEDLDLSTNALIGPLGPETMPFLPSLKTLSLENNQLSSICKGALKGASNLTRLSLNHNQIDVLEDHAFVELSSLRVLDLGSNRIVAVSSSSLAHLTELTELDLSHNFLRALTSDIIAPLPKLRILRLDDNDISMVETDTFYKETSLERLTLSDNPFNCDCNLVEFAVWFNNASRLSLSDRSTAVCMTPRHLENALLVEIPPSQLRCEEDDYDLMLQEGPSATHISGAQIVLRAFNFNGSSITLLWSIDTKAKSFSCDALFVYEEISAHEVLLTSNPLRCNSSQMADPTTLVVKLNLGSMQPYHRYRFCMVLLEDNKLTDEVQLVLGCSEVLPLIKTNHSVPQTQNSNVSARITSIQGKLTGDTLTVSLNLLTETMSSDSRCHVTVTIFMLGTLLSQHVLNCTNPKMSISGLPQGSYQVCASLNHYESFEGRLQCVTVVKSEATIWLTICFVLLTTFVLSGLYFLYRKIARRSRLKTTHQCFLGASEMDDQYKQHSKYVKLQATTNI